MENRMEGEWRIEIGDRMEWNGEIKIEIEMPRIKMDLIE
jgi:hypothetical protein